MSCSFESSAGNPVLYKEHFDFYKFGETLKETTFQWTMRFKDKSKKKIPFNNCNEITVFNQKDIALFDQFRFKLFVADCTALYKFSDAKTFNKTYFQKDLNTGFITSLPANIAPIINDHIFTKQKNKSFEEAYTVTKVQKKNKSVNIYSKEDHFSIKVLARGDFDEDGLEDLLIASEWYARNARGKFNDLVIVTKKSANKPIEITWRIHKSIW